MTVLLIPAPSVARDWDRIVSALQAAGLELVIGNAADLSGDLAGVEVIAGPGTLPITASLIDRSPRLRALVSIGSGCEGFDRDAARARGIRIATGATRENVVGMASAAIMLMLALRHDLPGAQRALAAGRRRDIGAARTLDDAVVGIIGYGAVGREVARRLRAWDVTVRAYSPSLVYGPLTHGVEAVDLDTLVAGSDIVSLHAAMTPATRNLIDARRLAMMKSGALLVNTARGELVDEAALIAALTSDRLAGAALDCFVEEPLPVDSPLRSLSNVILTPHQIGHTVDGARSVVDAFVANILAVSARL